MAWPAGLRWPTHSSRFARASIAFIEVTDDQIEDAMRAIYDDTHNTVEGAAAASVAAMLSERDRIRGCSVGIGLTGANVNRAAFARILAKHRLHRIHRSGDRQGHYRYWRSVLRCGAPPARTPPSPGPSSRRFRGLTR